MKWKLCQKTLEFQSLSGNTLLTLQSRLMVRTERRMMSSEEKSLWGRFSCEFPSFISCRRLFSPLTKRTFTHGCTNAYARKHNGAKSSNWSAYMSVRAVISLRVSSQLMRLMCIELYWHLHRRQESLFWISNYRKITSISTSVTFCTSLSFFSPFFISIPALMPLSNHFFFLPPSHLGVDWALLLAAWWLHLLLISVSGLPSVSRVTGRP